MEMYLETFDHSARLTAESMSTTTAVLDGSATVEGMTVAAKHRD
jgi:hypothetical protein